MSEIDDRHSILHVNRSIEDFNMHERGLTTSLPRAYYIVISFV